LMLLVSRSTVNPARRFGSAFLVPWFDRLVRKARSYRGGALDSQEAFPELQSIATAQGHPTASVSGRGARGSSGTRVETANLLMLLRDAAHRLFRLLMESPLRQPFEDGRVLSGPECHRGLDWTGARSPIRSPHLGHVTVAVTNSPQRRAIQPFASGKSASPRSQRSGAGALTSASA
jgi:hypothetical protein